MAVIDPVVTRLRLISTIAVQANADVISITWADMAAGDTCTAVEGVAYMTDKHAQFIGTVGGSTLTGSDDGGNTFNDVHLVDGITPLPPAAGLWQILESPHAIRPEIGGGAAGLTVIVVGRIPVV